MINIAIVATHPIQYHIPWYKQLAEQRNVNLIVYFALMPEPEQQGVGFGIPFSWDIPILEGYRWMALRNTVSNPNLKGFYASSTPAIFDLLCKNRPDVVILNGWQSLPLLQALAACILLGIPRMVRGDSNAMRNRPFWIRTAHRLLMKQYNAFLYVGEANRDFYLQNGVSEKRLFFGPHFIDNNFFLKRKVSLMCKGENIRKKWGLDQNKTCFVFIGKFEPKKRIFDLLNAFKTACKKNSKIQLLMVGAGELLDKAKEFVNENKLPVSFSGFLNQTEVPKTYVAGDCLILPSDFGETWGLVVNEAMACGLPAIISDRVGCGPDLIIEGKTGYRFPLGDTDTLAHRMLELAKTPERIRKMGKNAQKHIQTYSVENTVTGTMQGIKFVSRQNFSP